MPKSPSKQLLDEGKSVDDILRPTHKTPINEVVREDRDSGLVLYRRNRRLWERAVPFPPIDLGGGPSTILVSEDRGRFIGGRKRIFAFYDVGADWGVISTKFVYDNVPDLQEDAEEIFNL